MQDIDIHKLLPFLTEDPVFKRLSEITDLSSLSWEERRLYDESIKHYRDTIAVMHGQYLEGLAAGRAEAKARARAEARAKAEAKERAKGWVEGRAKAVKDVAQRMKAKGYSKEEIAELTGLPPDEIELL